MEEAAPSPVSITALTGPCLSQIFSHLGGGDLAAAAQVNRQWRDFLRQEDATAWRRVCASDWQLAAPTALDGAALPSWRAAYAAWSSALGRYGPLGRRARAAWAAIEAWTGEHLPEVAASLRPGASEEALDRAEGLLGVALPPALRALYRLHDGQGLEFDRQIDCGRTQMHASIFHGLFGGYAFYSHLVSTRMLPLQRLVRWTAQLQRQGRPASGPEHPLLVFAANYNFNKTIFCDVHTGQVRIASVEREPEGYIPAVPDLPGASDGVLRWFEAYAAALVEGRFAVEPLDGDAPESRAISLFPRTPPWQSEAVTRGVRVRASAIYVPELTQVMDGGPQHFFAYSIRMALLPEEGQAAEAGSGEAFLPLHSAQLRSRHWLIRGAAGAVESEVRGEAVVGHYPLLRPGEPEFSYQSCTHQFEPTGSMEGSFAFVEGSLEAPRGDDFPVAVARFHLEVPDIVF